MVRAREAAMNKAGSENLLDCIQYKPTWMGDDVWKDLCINHWSGEKWNHKSAVARANKNTEKNGGICKSVCGSVPVAAHARKLVNAIIFH